MSEVIGSNGFQNGILDKDGILIKVGFYNMSSELKEGESLREDVPIPGHTISDPQYDDYYQWDGSSFISVPKSTIITIANNWRDNFNDYKTARVQIYVAMMTKGGFNNLSQEEKKIVSSWFLVGDNERDTVHTQAEQIANGEIFNKLSTEARIKRLTKVKMEVYNRLSHDQINSILEIMLANKVMFTYINLGTEGTLEGDNEGLFDYILSRTGTIWENTGLSKQSYSPKGMSDCQELANRLIDILKNGNY
jgi:hypothetical protein